MTGLSQFTIDFRPVIGRIDLRRGLRSGEEYITVAVTTKLAPIKKEIDG